MKTHDYITLNNWTNLFDVVLQKCSWFKPDTLFDDKVNEELHSIVCNVADYYLDEETVANSAFSDKCSVIKSFLSKNSDVLAEYLKECYDWLIVKKLTQDSFPDGTSIVEKKYVIFRGGKRREIKQWWCTYKDKSGYIIEVGFQGALQLALVEFRNEFDKIAGKEYAQKLFTPEEDSVVMTEQDIKNNNKLIAKFDGFTLDDDLYYRDYSDGRKQPRKEEDGFYYHESFDWLMPVVERIENLGYDFQIDTWWGVNEQGKTETAETIVDITHRWRINRVIPKRFHNKSKIAATYEAVVEFVKWYNANK